MLFVRASETPRTAPSGGSIKAIINRTGKSRRGEILLRIEKAKGQGISRNRSCALWMIERRRVVRWSGRLKRGQRLANGKLGPREPVHRLLPEERRAVLLMAREQPYADLSHRILAVTAWDLGLFWVSFSSVYRILRSEGLMSLKGHQGHHNGRSVAPERKEITDPNQRWCWDISYLHTYKRGLSLYLCLLLDECSRKVIHWRIGWHLRAQEARLLLEGDLAAENILDCPVEKRPEVLNDRGRQMKAGSVKKVLELDGMPQLFARPRTPNDNLFVESAFGAVKSHPNYPGRLLDRQEAIGYLKRYFRWYNTEHLHSGINYVTPEQCHLGLRDEIVAHRRAKLQRQRRWREAVNRQGQDFFPVLYEAFTTSQKRVADYP